MMPQYDFLDRFRGMQSPAGGGGIGSDARFGAQQSSPYGAALDMLRAGRGWSIANTPSPASQGGLANRINQGIQTSATLETPTAVQMVGASGVSA